MNHAGKRSPNRQGGGWQAFKRCTAVGAFGFGALLGLWAGAIQAQPVGAPNCIVTAQNRSVPMGAEGGYVLPNLPGRGRVPFGAGVSGQPFRVRALCDDGRVGETPVAFPVAGYELVQLGDLSWGVSTQPPVSLSLGLPAARIGFGASMQAQVVARYPDARTVDVSARRTGTGYRSSQPGFVGVSDDGGVYVQGSNVLFWYLRSSVIPPRVLISAENDGVVSTRLLKVSDGSALRVAVSAPSGFALQGSVASVALEGDGFLEQGLRAAVGSTVLFSDLPFQPPSSSWVLQAFEPVSRAYARQSLPSFTAQSVDTTLALQAPGRVTVKLVDEQGQPIGGASVGLQDAASALAGIGPLVTAADGTVEFAPVAAGRVAPLINLPNVYVNPGANELPPGGHLTLVATARATTALNATQIRGRLLGPIAGGTALGMSVVLSNANAQQLVPRQLIDGTQQFSFSGLSPNTSYVLSVAMAGDELLRVPVRTGAANSSTQADLQLPAIAVLGGSLVNEDGSPRLGNCSVQLFGQATGAFRRVNADSQGLFSLGRLVTPDLYRLEVNCDDSMSTQEQLDWTAGVPNGKVNRQLVLTSGPVSATVDISATVMGRFMSAPLAAQVMVENRNCPTACLQGVLANAGEHLRLEMPRGEHRFSVTWAGRIERFTITIDSRNAGTLIPQVVNFGPDVSRLMAFSGQQSIYEFAGAGSGKLELVLAGLAKEGFTAAQGLVFELYNGAGQLLASSAGQTNDLAMTLPSAGRFLVQVRQSDPSQGAQLGGYGLVANLNGTLLPLRAWLPDSVGFGSGLRGHVRLKDGSPAVGQLLRVKAGQSAGPQLVEQVNADSDGAFHYNSLLPGDVEVRALYKGATLGRAVAPLSAEGQFIELDLDLREKADLALTLRFSSMAMPLARVRVEVVDGFGPRQEWLSVAAGATQVDASLGAVAGNVIVQAEHPGNPSYLAMRQVNAAPDATEAVDLSLLSGRMTGRVVDGGGRAVAGASVNLKAEDGGTQHTPQVTDASGNFSFAVVPAQVALNVQASDAVSETEVSKSVALQSDQDLGLGALSLATGRLAGDVRFSDQLPAANYQLELTLASGRQLYATTDANGHYEFVRVPAGVSLQLRLVNNNATQTASVAVGDVLTMPVFVIAKNTYTIRGLVASDSGVPLAGVSVVLSNDKVVADCSPAGASGVGPNTVLVRTDSHGGFELQLARVPATSYLASAAIRSGGLCRQAFVPYAVGAADTLIDLGTLKLNPRASFGIKVQDSDQRALSSPYARLTCEVGDSNPSQGIPEIRLMQPDGNTKVLSPLQLQLSDVPIGHYRATLSLCGTSFGLGELDLGVDDKSSLNLVVPIASGRLLDAEGKRADVRRLFGRFGNVTYGVQEVEAELTRLPANGTQAEALMYRIPVGVERDHYLLLAELPNSVYEWARFTGPLSAPPQSTALDLQLGPRARVQGCVKQVDGSIAAGSHTITLAHQPSPDWQLRRDDFRQVQTSSGCFQFDDVPNGVVELLAVSNSGAKLATELVLDVKSEAEIVNQDLRYMPEGSLRVKGVDTSGQGIAMDYAIYQRRTMADSFIGPTGVTGSAGQQGRVITGLAEGDYLLSAWNDAKCLAMHVPVKVVGGQQIDLELRLLGDGSFWHAASCPKEDMSVAKGAVNYLFAYDGSFADTGWSPFDWLTFVDWSIGGHYMPNSQILARRVGTREYSAGPFLTPSGVEVVRRYHVPRDGGYARILDSYSNSTNLPATVVVQHRTLGRYRFGYAYSVDEIKPGFEPSRGFTSFVVRQVDDQMQIPRVSVVHVFGGTESGTLAPDRVDAFSEYGPMTQWTLTLMPGETAALLHFTALNEFYYKGGAVRALAEALASQSKEGMFDGLSASDKALIRNFNIRP